MSRPPNPGAQGLGLHPASLAAAEPSPAACGLPDPAPPPLRLRAAARLPAGLHSLQPPAPDFSRRHHPPHPPRGLPGRGRSQGAPPRTASQSRVGKGIVVRRHLRAGRQTALQARLSVKFTNLKWSWPVELCAVLQLLQIVTLEAGDGRPALEAAAAARGPAHSLGRAAPGAARAEGFRGWEVEHGGNGWAVEKNLIMMPGAPSQTCFVTSFESPTSLPTLARVSATCLLSSMEETHVPGWGTTAPL
ncbi:F-box only protein 17 isoform X3 [Bubalus bubalis]|uniref:F-box only protein 17 isoform X3 n=1 Tax=Bubalus bubalis TaxID=89462 RepID=UPI001E1B7CE4|nr:F-box only protein 17 isoform X3 [Bubalus bubalis]